MEEPAIAFKGFDLYEKSISSLSNSFQVKTDQKRSTFLAVYTQERGPSADGDLCAVLKARSVEPAPDAPLLGLIRFKNYWDEKAPLFALRIETPRAVRALWNFDLKPFYLCHVNHTIEGEVSRFAHEVKLFWDLRVLYQAAEQAISSNHFNLLRNFGVDSNIKRLPDYARFLKIWNRDYYIWKTQVSDVLDQLAYQPPS